MGGMEWVSSGPSGGFLTMPFFLDFKDRGGGVGRKGY